MDRFLRLRQGKSRSNEIGIEPPIIRINAISLSVLESSKAFKTPNDSDSTVIIRVICKQSTIQTDGSAFATNMVWKPAFEVPLADFVVDVVLKRTERFKPDRKLGSFSVNAAQLILDEREGIFKETYRSSKDNYPSFELTISFSGFPTSSTIPPQTASSAAQPSSLLTTTVPDDHMESAVDHAATNADALHSPAGLEAGVEIIDTVTQYVDPVQSALETAQSLKGTLQCLADSAGYIDGVIGLVKDFADIHPISKIAVDALTKVYDLVKKQGERDESIQALASSMRDMLASLSEVKDLGKIEMLRSVISLAMSRVRECAKFIDAYAQHGFWSRVVRQSLSSRTADTIQSFQQGFGELKEKFSNAVAIQTLKVVSEGRQAVEVLKSDLRNIGDALKTQADKDWLDQLPRSKRAAYDRGLQCLPGTRQDILRLIYGWIDNKEPGNNVFWLRGAAGSGKSTVASTVAAVLDSTNNGLRQLGLGCLGATFFCKRDDSTLNQPPLVFPTIAFRLASTYPLLREGILSALKANQDVGESSITNQFQELIVEPLSKLPEDLVVPPVVAIIDAADECGNESTREPLLRCLKEVCRLPIWFKVLVTSRPEQDIKKCLTGLPSGHEVDTSSPQSVSDIIAYTQDRIASLRAERELGDNWPGDPRVNQLISRAGGLFIWVTLSFKFMSQHPSPSEALELVLKPSGQPHLDVLYDTVLVHDLVKEEHLVLIRSFLGCVVVTKIPLSLRSLYILLNIEYEKAKWVRDKLASVLSMDSHTIIRVIHPSFLDFLTNSQRSNKFYIDVDEHNLSIACGCFRVMNDKLHANICRLPGRTILNDDISDVASCPEEYVPEDLAYTCQFWSEHLRSTGHDPELLCLLQEFCHSHFLHWLEVMSMKAEVRSAILAVRNIKCWLLPNDPLMGVILDLIRLCASCGYVVRHSALHIYLSAALFTPPESPISMLLRGEFLTPPKLENPPDVIWDPGLLTLNGHRSSVNSVAFSPDGKKIVSGSNDKTLHVWDSESGVSILGPLVGHTDSVTSVAFSYDGTKIVSGSNDKTLHVWDSESGLTILGLLVGHTDSVQSVAFSHDGKKIVSGSYDRTLCVWDCDSGLSILRPLVGHTDSVMSVAFAPDGKRIVSGSSDMTLCVWDSESGWGIYEPLVGHTDSVTSVTFSPDGKKILSGSYDNTLRVWDSESGLCILGPLMGHTGAVMSVAFSPDGEKFVSGSNDRTLCGWDSALGLIIFGPFMGHTGMVISVAFSSDGKRIVSGSFDKTLRVWDSESGKSIIRPLVGHTQSVWSVAFSPDGKKIVSGSYDETLRVWDSESGLCILGPMLGHTHGLWSVAFSPDGKKIVSGSYDKTLRIWDSDSGLSILGPLVGHMAMVTSVAFSSDGKKIVSGSSDKTICVWESESGMTILGPLVGHTNGVMSIAFSPDGKKIVSGSSDKTLHIWDAESGLSIFGPLVGHRDSVMSVAFSPDGKRIVSGSHDKALHVWDSESGLSILGPLVGHTHFIMSVVFSPDGKKILSSSNDRTLRIWDSESGISILGPLMGHTDCVVSVSFSPDGKKIVSGSHDKTLRVWDSVSGLSILGLSVGHRDSVNSVAFSPDRKKIVSGSNDKTLHVWDSESGESILGPLVGHTGSVQLVAFSPDGKKIVSGSHDNTLHVWDSESGLSILGPLVGHTDSVMSVAFSPDGKKIVSGSHDKTLYVWDSGSGITILGPLVGHTQSVRSVAFSPDGNRIVSGSNDKTLHIWDLESRLSLHGPLVGHTDSVQSVVFSPDGKKIVSLSHEKRHFWDVELGLPISDPFTDNIHLLESVPHSSCIPAHISAQGWVVDIYGRKMLWIPAHLRGDASAAAIHGTRLVWFNSKRLPMIVSGLGFSWWSKAGTL